jgi:hypothetical protein
MNNQERLNEIMKNIEESKKIMLEIEELMVG